MTCRSKYRFSPSASLRSRRRPGSDGFALIENVSFDVHAHEVVGVVGESGSGKSITMLAVMGLLPYSVRIAAGQVMLSGQDLTKLSFDQMRAIRGRRMAMIFQDPMTSLNPVLRIGGQIGEIIALHQPAMSSAKIRGRIVELLELVGIPDAARRADQFPHQFSGGMRQRAMIAIRVDAARVQVLDPDPCRQRPAHGIAGERRGDVGEDPQIQVVAGLSGAATRERRRDQRRRVRRPARPSGGARGEGAARARRHRRPGSPWSPRRRAGDPGAAADNRFRRRTRTGLRQFSLREALRC